MMNIAKNPTRDQWPLLCMRPQFDASKLTGTVTAILDRVRQEGDAALLAYTAEFDGAAITSLRVTKEEIAAAAGQVPEPLREAIRIAAGNIQTFHADQTRPAKKIETTPGVVCWRKAVPIERVGLYIPGGSAPLFSTVLMLAIPAKLAGCSEIVLCTPPRRDGSIDPAILFAADYAGVTQIFKTGGAQAIAAMAFGTESIPACNKIFGPGNQYVTLAKQLVSRDGVAIDMPAGPSEVLVLADANADPDFVAADLLSQAEHGPDSQVMLVTPDEKIVSEVLKALQTQLDALPRKTIAAKSLGNSRAVIFDDPLLLMDFINTYAPEHLIIQTNNPEQFAEKVINAGSVFLGPYSPESVGDYASGTNHTLPTNGYAKAYAGVSLDTFVKYITFQELTRDGLEQLQPVVTTMAEAEQLEAHSRAIKIRLKK